jgi:hypothetical protein
LRAAVGAHRALPRTLAAYTFSIYLLHQPLIQFYAALINGDPSGPWFYVVTMLAVFASIFAIGSVTEQQRHHWRRASGWLATPAPQPLPAVVLGIDTPIGLAIIRDLGRHGVTVYGIARSEGALGLSSATCIAACCARTTWWRSCAAWARNRPGGAVCHRGDGYRALNKARGQLGGYRFMFADDVRMERVLRKDLTYAAAAQPACSCRAPGTRPAWTMRRRCGAGPLSGGAEMGRSERDDSPAAAGWHALEKAQYCAMRRR